MAACRMGELRHRVEFGLIALAPGTPKKVPGGFWGDLSRDTPLMSTSEQVEPAGTVARSVEYKSIVLVPGFDAALSAVALDGWRVVTAVGGPICHGGQVDPHAVRFFLSRERKPPE